MKHHKWIFAVTLVFLPVVVSLGQTDGQRNALPQVKVWERIDRVIQKLVN